MRFEWASSKGKANLLKHGVLFETATLVFDDPHAITLLDALHSEEEQRYITLGVADRSSMLFVVHTYQIRNDEEVIRIISARIATRKERKFYEKTNGGAAAKPGCH
jgi:hypothetical protein